MRKRAKKSCCSGPAPCNDAEIREDGSRGDPTEVALIKSAKESGLDTDNLESEHERVREVPFSSREEKDDYGT